MTATIEDYKHKVARLEAENRALRQRLDERDKTARVVERRLRAERDEGVSPQVAALRLQLETEKARHREYQIQIGSILAQHLAPLDELDLWTPNEHAVLRATLGEVAGGQYDKSIKGRSLARSGPRIAAQGRKILRQGTP